MTRSETAGIGLALLGHAALVAVLMLSFATRRTVEAPPVAMEVSLAKDVGFTTQAPEVSAEPPAPAPAPIQAPPEPAAASPAPKPDAPAPDRKAERKPLPMPDIKPDPKPKTVKDSGGTSGPAAAKPRQRASLLSEALIDKLTTPGTGKAAHPQAAAMSAQAQASIGAAIARQVQPCADRQVNPGPGSERIHVLIHLQFNRDGSFAARPTVVADGGVDDTNRRYVERVKDLAIATFVGCSPLRGLPDELYDVPNGWKTYTMGYHLPR